MEAEQVKSIPQGYRVTHRMLVEERMTVDFEQQEPRLGRLHGVYATYWLALHFEMVSRKLSLSFLEEDEEGIGYELSVRHLAPALPGTGLELEARHLSTRGNRLYCECRATDGYHQLVGEGTTTQVILNRRVLEERFEQLRSRPQAE